MATAKKSAAGAKKAAAKKSSAKSAGKSASKTAGRGAGAGSAAKKAPAKKAAAKGGAAKQAPAAKKAPAATKTAAKGGAAPKKRALNPALAAPMQPSGELAAVIGNKPMPRSEVAKQIWAYIKKNGLQDQTNKRNINADDNLKKVFGGKGQVSMFEMTALVSKHLKPA